MSGGRAAINRRGFLKGSAAAAAALGGVNALGGCAASPGEVGVAPGPAGEAGIEHIIVVMMENRSFDHLLGWLPGADGKQAGLAFVDRNGVEHETHRMTTSVSCGFDDPDHSYKGGRIEFNGGRCDGFLLPTHDTLPIGYYEQADLPFMGQAAPAWTVLDRYFAATMGPTFPNRFYMHAAATDRWQNTFDISSLPTIWSLLESRKLVGRYYYVDAPVLALWGLRHANVIRPFDGFLSDCATGQLPHLSYVDPRFLIPPLGTSADYHPHSDIRAGEAFLDQVYAAVTSGPKWENTLMVINFDEWGGFYDHVAPEVAPDRWDYTAQRGFRVPCLVVSPYARRNHVAHETYDHASVLKMIEWAFDLPTLSPRDAAANNLADVLDLSSTPDTSVPSWEFPEIEFQDCSQQFIDDLFNRLAALGSQLGIS